MTSVRVNKWLDFIDRVGWTAIYAIAAALVTVLTSDGIGWEEGLKFLGVSVALAVCKVTVAQRTGNSDLGDAVPGKSVIE